ncbi:predicted protein [Meyerozyma guilliermondii ATCC 6260]|uniref:Uncharacterized protein n=1 Tax=Meyerozyma guilliermondii (strain ATCC 6260 / CBS 566 / DSM 6381 / JCM 1539 / NBRC 10279 / NRRL Y-324) TaxID=294746 RepID=A5DC06_PICGU|nr:uncharacterized protein PGUG_00811 [Meyerozyma guilliermondii ATCC 6260]EDK36713.2 predicted protein [Meyerozyma guilliermondii ATCC 6260]
MNQDTFVQKTYTAGTIPPQRHAVAYQAYPTPSGTSHYPASIEQPIMVSNPVMKSPDGFLASQMNGFHLQSPATDNNPMFPSFTYNPNPPMASFQRPVKVPVSPTSNTVPKNLAQHPPFYTPPSMNSTVFNANVLPQTPAPSMIPAAAGQLGHVLSSPNEPPHVSSQIPGYYSTSSEKASSHNGTISQESVKTETSPSMLNQISPEDIFATSTEPEEGDFPDTTNVTIDDILKEDPFVDLKPETTDNEASFMSCFLDLDELSGDDIPVKAEELSGLGIYSIGKDHGDDGVKSGKRTGDILAAETIKTTSHAARSEKASKERTLKKSKSFSGNATMVTKVNSGLGTPHTPSTKQRPKFSFSECSGEFAVQSSYSFVLENSAMAGNKPSTSRRPERPIMKRAVTYALDTSPTKTSDVPPPLLKSMESGCLQFQVDLGKNM